MKKVQRDMWIRELEAAQVQFDEAVYVIADQIRKQVIIPVCRANKLEFLSGNGDYFFTTQSGNHFGSAGDAEGTRLERILKPVFELLHTQVSHNSPLGFRVEDVRKKDYS